MADGMQLSAGDGVTATVPGGHYVWLRDDAGSSAARLWLFNADDVGERLSLSHTRISMGHLFLAPTSNLVGNRRATLARICEDDVKAHDILTGSIGEGGVPAAMSDELAASGVPASQLPDPVRLFTPVRLLEDMKFERLDSASTEGASFVLLAAMNLLVGLAIDSGAVRLEIRERMPAKEVA